MMNSTIIVIPAYNPDTRLIDLVNELKEKSCCQVVVVDDGSEMEYKPVFDRLKGNVTLLNHKENLGKGEAIKTALLYLYRNAVKPFTVVTADADGQHLANDILLVGEEANSHPGTFVLGCRGFDGDVPFRSRFGNLLTKAIFQISTRQKVTDTQTGLRAFSDTLIPMLYGVEGKRYEYETNVLLQMVREMIPLREVRISTVYQQNNNSSHFHVIRDSILIYKEIIKFSCSSLASFFIDYMLYSVFSVLTGQLIMSNVAARFMSATFNYSVNRRYVFESDTTVKKSALQYAALALGLLVINTTMLYVLVDVFHQNRYFCKLIVELALFLISLFIQRIVIFPKQKYRDNIQLKKKEGKLNGTAK